MPQTFFIKPPSHGVDPVLTKERFAIELECRHTPVAGSLKIALIELNFRMVRRGVGDRLVHAVKIKTGSGCGVLQMTVQMAVARAANKVTADTTAAN